MKNESKKSGIKGFGKGLKCRGFQFEIGKSFEHTGHVNACASGFHFCENPLDVLGYYPPSESRYAEVEGDGDISRDGKDSKIACGKITIKAELTLSALLSAGVKFILDRVDFKNAAATNTGDYSAATNTGYQSAATNTGDYSAATNTGIKSAATNTGDYSAATNTGIKSAATNTGDYSAATVEGKQSVAVALGFESKAKGILGCWLVVAERDYDGNLLAVLSSKVDGVGIKENVFYSAKAGKFIEVE